MTDNENPVVEEVVLNEEVPATEEQATPVENEEEVKTSKMSRKTYNLILRLVAGVAAALILVSGIQLISGFVKEKNAEKSSLLSQASGLKDDFVIMTVDGEDVTSEEYLYWVSRLATELNYYYGIEDWNEEISDDGITAGDHVKSTAEYYCIQYASMRKWAKDLGIELTEENLADIQAQIDESRASYETEESFRENLKLQGISENLFKNALLPFSYYYEHILDAYENGNLKPTKDQADALIEEHGLLYAKEMCFEAESLEQEDLDAAREKAEDYLKKLNDSEDMDATWLEIAAEVGEGETASLYDCCEDDLICKTLSALEEGQVSNVVEENGVFYLLYRVEMDYSTLGSVMCSEDFELRTAGADIQHTEEYESLDVSTFFAKFSEAQSALYNKLYNSDEG